MKLIPVSISAPSCVCVIGTTNPDSFTLMDRRVWIHATASLFIDLSVIRQTSTQTRTHRHDICLSQSLQTLKLPHLHNWHASIATVVQMVVCSLLFSSGHIDQTSPGNSTGNTAQIITRRATTKPHLHAPFLFIIHESLPADMHASLSNTHYWVSYIRLNVIPLNKESLFLMGSLQIVMAIISLSPSCKTASDETTCGGSYVRLLPRSGYLFICFLYFSKQWGSAEV